jgi:phosphohistidine swiveling domain-containing protein
MIEEADGVFAGQRNVQCSVERQESQGNCPRSSACSAAAIVERRGGMLIHGAIIAREMGIPCVNGVVRAVELLGNGELVIVDGHLAIVTVGPPEFDLELV